MNPSSLWRDAWRRLVRNRLAVACLFVFCVVALFCTVGPWLSPYSEITNDLAARSQPPGADHWMGTDILGRDQLTRICQGGRISLAVGLLATAVALVIGVIYGAVAAYAGGKIDALMMRVVDILYGIPFIIFVILVIVTIDPLLQQPSEGLVNFFSSIGLAAMLKPSNLKLLALFAIIGAFEWLTLARIVRAQIVSLKKQDFVTAAVALGVGHFRILFRHLVPNALGPVIVYTTLTVPSVMLLEAVLSFLGLGVQAPFASWGVLIQEGAASMEDYPWLLVFPAALFSVTLFSLNFIGDGLRDALDPKSQR